MRERWQNLPHHASKHPLIAGFLTFVFVVTLGLGVIHECRLAGEILIVIVKHAKHELAALGDVWERLKREFRSSAPSLSRAEGNPASEAPTLSRPFSERTESVTREDVGRGRGAKLRESS